MRLLRVLVLLSAACGSAPARLKLEAVAPSKGSARGGQTVTLSGSGFRDGVSVTVGGRAAKVTDVSDREVSVVVPRAVAGAATVEVALEGAKSGLDGGFTYEAISLAFVDVAGFRMNGAQVDGADAVIADLDGDARAELIQAVRGEGVWVHGNLGAASFAAPQRLVMVGSAPDGGPGGPVEVRSVVAGDFDGDAQVDLIVAGAGRAQTQFWRGNGSRVPTVLPAGRVPASFGVEPKLLAKDLDGDRDLDLVSLGAAASATGAPQVQLFINDGAGTFSDATASRLAGAVFDAPGVAAGDLDGDGHVDLFFSGGADFSRIYLSDGKGVFQRTAPDALPNDAKPGGGWPSLGDLDGDGSLDIFLPTATQDRVYFNDGSAHFDDVSTLFLGAEGGNSHRAELVDLDLDGALDVLVLDRPGRVRMYRNDGDGRLFDYSFELVGNDTALSHAGLAVGDLDGDGDDDLFVSRGDVARPALFLNWAPSKLSAANADGDPYPDEIDNCPAKVNADQADTRGLPFGCRSSAQCKAVAGCELKVQGDSAYLFCRDAPLSWPAAQAKCKERGGNLISISGAEENAWLSVWGASQAWIGFQDQATENTFVWASGEGVTYKNWGQGQPDNSQGLEDCVALIGGPLIWNDDQCGVAKPYICETVRQPMSLGGDACRTDAGM